MFTQVGKSYSLPMVLDINSPLTWAVTWRCSSVKCWFRPKYRPSQGAGKSDKVTLEYTGGKVKGTTYIQDDIVPVNSI